MPFNKSNQWEPIPQNQTVYSKSFMRCQAVDSLSQEQCKAKFHLSDSNYCRECGKTMCNRHFRARYMGCIVCDQCHDILVSSQPVHDFWRKDHPISLARTRHLSFNSTSSSSLNHKKIIWKSYYESLQTIDESVVKAAINLYLSGRDSILLTLIRRLSNRYYQMLCGYCHYLTEKAVGKTDAFILPSSAGILKQHGFTYKDIDKLVHNWTLLIEITEEKKINVEMAVLRIDKDQSFVEELRKIGVDVDFLKKTLLLLRRFGHLTLDRIEIIMQELFSAFYKNKLIQYSQQERKLLALFGDIIVKNDFDINESETFIWAAQGEFQPDKITDRKLKFILDKRREFSSQADFFQLKKIRLRYSQPNVMYSLAKCAYQYKKHMPAGIDYEVKERLHYQKNFDSILLSEIRHRVSGEGDPNLAYGNLGTNPLVWRNLFERCVIPTDINQQLCEFRNRMFFVYMLNHFANEIISDEAIIESINTYLRKSKFNWIIDKKFVEVIKMYKKETLGYLPPVFRYGTHASLNANLREIITSQEQINRRYRKLNAIDCIEKPIVPANKLSKSHIQDARAISSYTLSSKEILGMHGEILPESFPNHVKERNVFSSGSALFKMKCSQDSMTNFFLTQSISYGMKLPSGVSGTLDQSLTMAGLVGIGVTNNLARNEKELYDLRLAYIIFMGIPYDHSLHEIMFSSRSYGLKYNFNENFCHDLYPYDTENLLRVIRSNQQKSDHILPHEAFRFRLEELNIKEAHEKGQYLYKCRKVYKAVGSCYALIRSVNTYFDNDFDNELAALKYPATKRHHDYWEHGRNRQWRFNFLKDVMEPRDVSTQRGNATNSQGKLKEYTKKKSVTLLRPDGRTIPFEFDHSYFNSSVIMIYDYHFVHNKNNNYVFLTNALTDQRNWLEDNLYNNHFERCKMRSQFLPFEDLRNHLISRSVELHKKKRRKQKNSRYDIHNELLVGLQKEALIGIYVMVSPYVEMRLQKTFMYYNYVNLLYAYLKVKNELGICLPLFTSEPDTSVDAEQDLPNCVIRPFGEKDLLDTLNRLSKVPLSDYDEIERQFVEELYQVEDYRLLENLQQEAEDMLIRLGLFLPDQDAVLELKEEYYSQISQSYASVFHRNELHNTCEVCNVKFSILKSKYNCTNCGKVICSNCSRKGKFLLEKPVSNAYIKNIHINGDRSYVSRYSTNSNPAKLKVVNICSTCSRKLRRL